MRKYTAALAQMNTDTDEAANLAKAEDEIRGRMGMLPNRRTDLYELRAK